MSLAHLDVLKAEGDFAVFAVKCSGFAFSLVVTVFLAEKDEELACLTLHAFKFASAFVLALRKCNEMNGVEISIWPLYFIHKPEITVSIYLQGFQAWKISTRRLNEVDWIT